MRRNLITTTALIALAMATPADASQTLNKRSKVLVKKSAGATAFKALPVTPPAIRPLGKQSTMPVASNPPIIRPLGKQGGPSPTVTPPAKQPSTQIVEAPKTARPHQDDKTFRVVVALPVLRHDTHRHTHSDNPRVVTLPLTYSHTTVSPTHPAPTKPSIQTKSEKSPAAPVRPLSPEVRRMLRQQVAVGTKAQEHLDSGRFIPPGARRVLEAQAAQGEGALKVLQAHDPRASKT